MISMNLKYMGIKQHIKQHILGIWESIRQINVGETVASTMKRQVAYLLTSGW